MQSGPDATRAAQPAGRVAWMLVPMLLAGCARPTATLRDSDRARMLSLLMPRSIQIVQPFTRVEQVDPESAGDGFDFELDLLLRAANALDNPGLMIVGDVRVELYEFRPATAEPRGRRYSRWVIPLADESDQRAYWNPVTQMYEFRLGVRGADIKPAGKYVVSVTYNSPLGEHLSDECVVDVRKYGVVRNSLGDRG